MLDIGWAEMAMVALLALIVVGPKDLPKMMRTAGQWMRKARSVAREFQSGIDDMMRESELDEARKAIEKTRKFDVQKEVDTAIDPSGELRETAKDVEATTRDTASAGDSESSKRSPSSATDDGTAGGASEPSGDGSTAKKARTVRNDAPNAPGNSVKAGKPKASDDGEAKPDSDSKIESGTQSGGKGKGDAKATGGAKTKKGTTKPKTATVQSDNTSQT